MQCHSIMMRRGFVENGNHERRYYQPETETAPYEVMRPIQEERFLENLQHAYAHVAPYREKMKSLGIEPGDIKSLDDLHKLPFLSKEDLRDAYPYGYLALPLEDCVRIQSTSGTTGKRVVAFYTQADIDLWDECCARSIVAVGGTKDDVVHVCYGYGLFTGGPGLNGGSHKVGALTLPMSSGNTERQIQFMVDLGSTILCCTPSYAAFLAEHITGPGVSFECESQTGMHVNEDHFIPEIIDPDTGKVLPDGEKGELVFSCITKKAFPLLRYRTRDICVLSREKCACGRTLIKMSKPMGRSDDMLIIRGVNVFPSQIETVLMNAGYPSNYQIIVDRVHHTDTFEVQVEMTTEMFSDEVKRVEARESELLSAMRAMLGISPKVTLVTPKSIARSEGKAVRVIDKRKL